MPRPYLISPDLWPILLKESETLPVETLAVHYGVSFSTIKRVLALAKGQEQDADAEKGVVE